MATINNIAVQDLTKYITEKYIAYVNDEKRNSIVYIPVGSIDGVKIGEASILIYKHNIELCIIPFNNVYDSAIRYYTDHHLIHTISNPYSRDEEKHVCFTAANIQQAVESMFISLEELRWDNKRGRFLKIAELIEDIPLKAMYNLASMGKCKPDCNAAECCVCYDETRTHFKQCNHTVCGRCISNMKGKLKCPMCRVSINRNYEDSDEDQDDEEE